MSSAFTAISTAVATALAAAPAICHGVYTNLMDLIAEKLPTAVVVRLEQFAPTTAPSVPSPGAPC